MNTLKPMPLTSGFTRIGRLRRGISTLARTQYTGHESAGYSPGLDFPRFEVPRLSAAPARQAQGKPTPIDLRMRVDLRDVKLYVDVIVDMLLQSLDGRAYYGIPVQGGVSRGLASNPEVKRVLETLLERTGKLKANGSMSAEEILRALANEAPKAGEAGGAALKLPLSLKNIAVTREKSATQSRLGRRERLVREARRLVLAQLRILGQDAEVITKQKDSGSSLHMVVPDTGTMYQDTAPGADKAPGSQPAAEQKAARDTIPPPKEDTRQPVAEPDSAPQGFAPARVEYLQGYRRAGAGTAAEQAEKLVDAKTLAHLSDEAAASLNRMLEQGKLVPAKAAGQKPQGMSTAETVMTYATLHPKGEAGGKAGGGYNIIVKNLYYAEKMPDAQNIRLAAMSAANMSHASFGRGIGGFSGIKVVAEKKIAPERLAVPRRGAVSEQSGQAKPSMFFAEAPAAAAAAKIEAIKAEQAHREYPSQAAPDMARLKNELAKQAGKELDDIIKKKLNVDKLTDKIYRNLEDRLRSERIRRGII